MGFSNRSILNLGTEALWVLLGQVGTAVFGLLNVKILTFLLQPDQYGLLALANTVTMLLQICLFVPLGQGLLRFWPICCERGELKVYYDVAESIKRNALWVSLLLMTFISILIVFSNLQSWLLLLILAILTGIAGGLMGLRKSVFTAARNRRLVASIENGSAILRICFAAFFLALIAFKASWAMLGYTVSALIVLVGTEYFYKRDYWGKAKGTSNEESFSIQSRGLRKEVLGFAFPFLVWGIFTWIHTSCDRWSLQAFHGAEVVGAFAVISQLATFPLIFGSSFLHSLVVPVASQRAGDLAERDSIYASFKVLGIMISLYVLGAITLIVVFQFYHKHIVLLISNERFTRFSGLLPGLTIAWALFYLGQILSSFGFIENKPKMYIAPKILSSAIALGATFVLSFKMGVLGVVWALFISGFINALWCAVIAGRILLRR